jgi:hypothetical protein
MKNFLTDQQLGIVALLIICALAIGSGMDGSKDILLTISGALAGWLKGTVDSK